MKILLTQIALVCGAALPTLAMAAEAPAAPPVSDPCAPQTVTPERAASQQPKHSMHLMRRDCGLADASQDADERINTGEADHDPWQQAEDALELSRLHNDSIEHRLAGPAVARFSMGEDGRGVAGTPDAPHALMNTVPSVPEPSGLVLTSAGLLLLGGWSRLRRRARPGARSI
ncbi:hypothetical protein RugamoR57_54020 [Duganella caerulea]|uniref:PEP-CTERM sorting domain-containing protein n=1 Tax=Duganella caerulea TaxID=2885762 RepID=UPI0030EA7AF5